MKLWWATTVMVVGCGALPGTGGSVQSVATTQCASGLQWYGGSRQSSEMEPGRACIACHARGEGPTFTIAGTVYSALNQPDDCLGLESVQIQITDANGKVTTLNTNAAGNFYLQARSLAAPYTAKLIAPSGERVMGAAQTSGDCNSCHTEFGSQSAPGRISPL